ncbi:hypothetical protein BDR26DRAFT_851751 [Obelidium mucronatum]|nr:hypothetical protein BDR26DRAFT_851751 [Obelidium mucronatum]
MVLGSVYTECLPISSSSTCAPWNTGLFINITALATPYTLLSPLSTVQDWEQALQQQPLDDLGCTATTSLKPFKFMTTYLCMRDVLVLSAGCNDVMGAHTPSRALCAESCSTISNSFQQLFNDPEQCTETTDIRIGNKRSEVLEGADCRMVVDAWQNGLNGSLEEECIEAVDADTKQCGFGEDSVAAIKYCTQYGYNPTCCNSLKPDKKTLILNKAKPNATTTTTGTTTANSKNATIVVQPLPSRLTPAAITIITVGSLVAAALFVVIVTLTIERIRGALQQKNGGEKNGGEKKDQRDESKEPGLGLGVTVPSAGLKRGFTYERVPLREQEPLPQTASTVLFHKPLTFSPILIGQPRAEESSSEYRVGQECVVSEEYSALIGDELNMRVGDRVAILEVKDDGWARGRLASDGREGFFPLVCVNRL